MSLRQFDLGDILSVTTGRLVSPRLLDGVQDICAYMTGGPVFTHQIPRAVEACAVSLLAQHPQLAAVALPEVFDGKQHVRPWLATQVAAFGATLPVEPLKAGVYEHRNPVAELADMFGAERTVAVVVDGGA